MQWTNAKLMSAMADGTHVMVNGQMCRICGIRPESGQQNIHNWLVDCVWHIGQGTQIEVIKQTFYVKTER